LTTIIRRLAAKNKGQATCGHGFFRHISGKDPPADWGAPMNVILRAGTPADAVACGSICFEAFKSISSAHGFPWDLPSAEVGIGLIKELISNSGFYSIVAEADGKIVGSNFMDERSFIAGIGPITVDPSSQNQGIGRRLMLAALERSAERRSAGVRLVQSAYHNRSLCLYTKLGFDTREMLSKFDGTPFSVGFPGYAVRPAVEADLDICNALCRRVHGHDRGGELRDGIARGTARVVEHLGAVTAYTTDIAFFGHAVAETNRGIEALIGAATSFSGGGFLVPTRNNELFRWCLQNGLRLVHQMTLMTIGLYNEPDGAYLPSVLY
jgi:predicted N-acetyltransferase YhbS